LPEIFSLGNTPSPFLCYVNAFNARFRFARSWRAREKRVRFPLFGKSLRGSFCAEFLGNRFMYQTGKCSPRSACFNVPGIIARDAPLSLQATRITLEGTKESWRQKARDSARVSAKATRTSSRFRVFESTTICYKHVRFNFRNCITRSRPRPRVIVDRIRAGLRHATQEELEKELVLSCDSI